MLNKGMVGAAVMSRSVQAFFDLFMGIVGFVVLSLLLGTLTGCSGVTRYERVVYVSTAAPQPYMYQRYQPVYSAVPRVMPYYAGYQGPAPQYGPYGYSAAMTARVTPQVYVMPSPPVQRASLPFRVVHVHGGRR